MYYQINWVQRIPINIVINICTLGPIGYWSRAPGTIGTFFGMIYYTLIFHKISIISFVLLLILSVYFAINLCRKAEIIVDYNDPPEIILDEFIAVPICFLGTRYLFDYYPVWVIIILAFILFRFFDILKPLGIKYFEKFNNGFGIVLDDILAAIFTNIVLQIILVAYKFI